MIRPTHEKAVPRPASWFRGIRMALSFVCLVSLLHLSAVAQGITGSITGTITDATGAVLTGANVTVTQLQTNSIHVVTTTGNGNYTVTQLPPGTYSVRIEKAGFQ